MSRRVSRLIKFVRQVNRAVSRSRMPLRNSKYSNHIYNNHILTALAALREYLQLSYERFEDWLLTIGEELRKAIGLPKNRIPHFTTINKFLLRSKLPQLKSILRSFVSLCKLKNLHIAIDSTGHRLKRASHYYVITFSRTARDRLRRTKDKRPLKKYLKSTFGIEHRKQLIIAVKLRRGPANDSRDFKPVLKDTASGSQRVVSAVADKGYDAESNHFFCRKIIGAECIIPLRRSKHRDNEVHGWYRRMLLKNFPRTQYNRRVIVETVFSVMKRLMGDGIESKKIIAQNRQMILRGIAYNAHRMVVIFLVFKDF